ncbi:MAG: ABC transporter substrate-binding protein [Actinomycetota bacterium]|nr:ABC transporter substrate-binding protein [Actinomycetota bacterium]
MRAMFVSSLGGRGTLAAAAPGQRRRGRLISAAAVLLLLAGACDFGGRDDPEPGRSPLPTPTGSDTHIVGLVGSVSGPDAWRGADAIEGADLAIGLLNRGLEPGERPFELLTIDDESDPRLALKYVRQVAGLERAVGVIYAGPTEALPEAERELADAGVPALALYGDLYGARRLSPHVFQVGPSYLWEARRILAYFLGDRRYLRIGVVVEDSLDGRTAAAALRAAPTRRRARVLWIERYEEPGDLGPALENLKEARAEGLVIQGDPGTFEAALAELADMGATYTTTEQARGPRTRKERKRYEPGDWSPQVAGFDLAISPGLDTPPEGTVAAETYARGAHYLPIPTLEAFRDDFLNWWDELPLGFERRSFEATSALGWAVAHGEGTDLAATLETIKGRRWGGLDVTLGPDDHTLAVASTVGLWVIPSSSTSEAEDVPDGLPWVPLARGFSIDGETIDILARDWRYLIAGAPPPKAPPPDFDLLRFGVTSGSKDPVH